MEPDAILVTGAREHNLKNIDVSVPKKKLVVFTGPSGSGKSSMAIDTIYAEGRRRFVESLSAYARQFLGQKEKPKYDKIQGLSPSIAVEQKAASVNPRSTVGTITEIHDYLRVLYARLGVQHCTECDRLVEAQSAQQIVKKISELPEGTKLILLAPRIENRKGEHKEELHVLRKEGLVRVRLDGAVVSLEGLEALDKKKKHTLEAVVDRLVVKPKALSRITDSVEAALRLGDGRLIAHLPEEDRDQIYSERLACEDCGLSFPDLTPQSFSYNSPQGLCEDCNGLGHSLEMDPELVAPDPTKSIMEGALIGWPKEAMEDGTSWTALQMHSLADHLGLDLSRPWNTLPAKHHQVVLHGLGNKRIAVTWKKRRTYMTRWEGVLPGMKRRMLKTRSEERRSWYAQFHSYQPCMRCSGGRLRRESLAVRVGGKSVAEVCETSVAETAEWAAGLPGQFSAREKKIATELLKEIRGRLKFLTDVGLEYLSLSRAGPSLSGGESQRIQLASQIGSELSGVVYVLDEPSIGLHARDSSKLLTTLEHLRDKGNTIIVVEHDEETIERADWILDFGPAAGRDGGEVTAVGTFAQIKRDPNSLTGKYLSGKLEIPMPAQRRTPDPERMIAVRGARANNLKNVDVEIPLGLFVCVTGVSGAGKSSLVNQILLPGLQRALTEKTVHVGDHDAIEGVEHIDKVIAIDQQPIGRTPRSNPATYVKVFDLIRQFFAELPESLAFGFKPGRFSFNVKGGRCEGPAGCDGSGVKRIEMHFLGDVYVRCSECKGKRFNDATLRVTYQGKTISDVLDLTIAEAAELFRNHPKITRHLTTLMDVGLGYVALGQQSPTLSGGEAQRIKLSRELSKRATGRTLYVLDEPSTGLHFDDIKKLLQVLDRLVEAGNTVVVIEHNLDIVKTADWVIDLGPEGGEQGGRLLAAAAPEQVVDAAESYTGEFLAPVLGARRKKTAKKKTVAKTKTAKKKTKTAKTKTAKKKTVAKTKTAKKKTKTAKTKTAKTKTAKTKTAKTKTAKTKTAKTKTAKTKTAKTKTAKKKQAKKKQAKKKQAKTKGTQTKTARRKRAVGAGSR